MRGPTHKVTWYFDIVVTWQIKIAISVFSQGLCYPNLAGRWLRMRRTHLQGHVTHRLSGHVTNQKRYIFTFTRPMKPQTYQGGDLGWGEPTQKITWHFNCMVTWKFKNVIFLQPQSRRDVQGKLALAKINTKMRLHNCLCESRGFQIGRSSHRRCSIKKVLLKISQNWQENTCDGVSFLITLQVRPAKIKTPTQVFFCLQNFWEHFFYRILPGDCFWIGLIVKKLIMCRRILVNEWNQREHVLTFFRA